MERNLRKDLNYFAVHLKYNIVNQLINWTSIKIKLPTVNIQKKNLLEYSSPQPHKPGRIVINMQRTRLLCVFNTSSPTSSIVQFSSVQSLSRVRLFATPWIAAHQASLFITNSQTSAKLMCIESVMPSSHLILCHPLLLPPILPASESFPVSQLFAWGGQSTGVSASASFPPKKSQGWSPSEWTGWISLQSKGLSRVFSNTTVQKHQFFGAQLSSQSKSHIHTWPLEKP